MGPFGHGAVLLPDPGLRGPPRSGSGPVLAARRLAPAVGPQGSVLGPLVFGAAAAEPPAAARRASRPLLRLVLRQVRPRAADCRGSGSGLGPPSHTQKEKRLDKNVYVSKDFRVPPGVNIRFI